ncbi:MAG: hypothetical protein WDO16_04150 [Bacteroidota bacterium]
MTRSTPILSGLIVSGATLGGINGEVIVGSNTAGVSISNIYNRQAGYTRIFSDGGGNFYDTYVTEMAEDRHGNIWIGGPGAAHKMG